MQNEVFQKIKKCLYVIPEIVVFFRKQMFFEGSKCVNKLIENVGAISDYIIKCDMPEEEKQEWILILQAFLGAQECRDYILMADVLERDMLLFLQRLQGGLIDDNYTVIDEYWKENMNGLQIVNPSLYKAVLRDSLDEARQSISVQYEPMLAINGEPTLKVHMGEKTFCLHSTVNPGYEAEQLAKSWLEVESDEYRIFGMGMGYHIKALLQADENIKVTVYDYRIEALVMAFTYFDWREYLLEGRLDIVYEAELLKVLQEIKKEQENCVFFIHYPSLQCVEQLELKVILEDYFITTSSMREQEKSLDINFRYIQKQKFPSCDVLRDKFIGKKVVIVAGGPSVDVEMDSLKQFREQLTILSVGTVARKLLTAGIRPDAIIVTDPQDTMYRQVEGLEIDDIPLMHLSTASRTVVKYYKGPIYVVYQQGYEPAEKIANECGHTLFQTGGSVTTTALDVSIRFGAEEIIFVGADMGYTNNCSHAGGLGHEESDFSSFRKVPSVDGGFVYATRNLDIYRKWIERRISGLAKPVVYNTSRGARIAGTIEARLVDIVYEKEDRENG